MQACLGAKNVEESTFHHCASPVKPVPGEFFFWTRFENLVAKRWKINDRVVLILVAVRNWNDVICLSRSEKVAEFARCVVPCRLKLTRLCQKS